MGKMICWLFQPANLAIDVEALKSNLGCLEFPVCQTAGMQMAQDLKFPAFLAHPVRVPSAFAVDVNDTIFWPDPLGRLQLSHAVVDSSRRYPL